MRVKEITFGCLLLTATASVSQMSSPPPPAQKETAPKKAQSTQANRGQEVFNQNCYRCHQAPEGFSPSVSGTIARHMRVRAGLSDEDYKALMKFLNP